MIHQNDVKKIDLIREILDRDINPALQLADISAVLKGFNPTSGEQVEEPVAKGWTLVWLEGSKEVERSLMTWIGAVSLASHLLADRVAEPLRILNPAGETDLEGWDLRNAAHAYEANQRKNG